MRIISLSQFYKAVILSTLLEFVLASIPKLQEHFKEVENQLYSKVQKYISNTYQIPPQGSHLELNAFICSLKLAAYYKLQRFELLLKRLIVINMSSDNIYCKCHY